MNAPHDGFTDFIAIDWSGQAVERPKGLAVAHAEAGTAAPLLIDRDWSRHDSRLRRNRATRGEGLGRPERDLPRLG